MEAGHNQPIIIKKVHKHEGHGHHGGAWKVAYADFVTAMMAFFLLLWLLQTTTDEQKNGIADYFTPTTATLAKTSGSGDILAGRSFSSDGARIGEGGTPSVVVALPPPPDRSVSDKELAEAQAKKEQEMFEEAMAALEKALAENPQLADLKNNIRVDVTSEGMRIQIVDQQGGALFESGSAAMRPRTRELIAQISKVVNGMPNDISISGHTDSTGFQRGEYGNWELSSDRANSSRRALISSGVASDRITQVVGKADQEPLIEEDPSAPQNRRVSIVLKRTAGVLPPELEKK